MLTKASLPSPGGAAFWGSLWALQAEGWTLNLPPTAFPPCPRPTLRCGSSPPPISDPSHQATPPTRQVKRGPSGDRQDRSPRGLNPGVGRVSSRQGVHTLGDLVPGREALVAPSVQSSYLTDRTVVRCVKRLVCSRHREMEQVRVSRLHGLCPEGPGPFCPQPEALGHFWGHTAPWWPYCLPSKASGLGHHPCARSRVCHCKNEAQQRRLLPRVTANQM